MSRSAEQVLVARVLVARKLALAQPLDDIGDDSDGAHMGCAAALADFGNSLGVRLGSHGDTDRE